VTGVVMPGVSGGQLAEIVDAKCPDMKVRFISGYAERVVHHHKIVDIHTNFLQKPSTLQSLALKIRETLVRRRARGQGGRPLKSGLVDWLFLCPV
jgi:two-component system, cell cycle sensor histidine kinase and response regulator CckA